MTTRTPTPIQRAMAAQLKRVNESPEVLLRRLAEAEAQIAIRDELITKLQQRLIDQEADRLSSPSPSMERGQGGEVHSSTKALEYLNNRPVLTLKQVAAHIGVEYHSAARYARAGAWQLTKVNGTVYVYADQPISKPAPKRRAKKAA